MKRSTLFLIVGAVLLLTIVAVLNVQDSASPAELAPAATAAPTAEPTPTDVGLDQVPATPDATPTMEQAVTDGGAASDTAADSEPASAPEPESAGNSAEGIVALLSDSLHGAMTASGVPYDKDAMVAAHKDLPFGTVVTVINLFNGNSVAVEIVDRLPPTVTALIDVSSAAARELDMIDAGMVDGRIEW